MLHPAATVSPQLKQPLYIDTDINYSLDMSKFPGLDDPSHLQQPALLIATPDTVSNYFYHCAYTIPPSEVTDVDNAMSSCCVQYPRHVYTPSKFPDNNISNHSDASCGHILEDILNVIDTCADGLLERLMKIPESTTSSNTIVPNTNTPRLCHSDLSHPPLLSRNYQQNGHIHYRFFHGARHVQNNTPSCPTGDTGLRRISDCVRNLQSLSAVKDSVSYKRKRTHDGFESDIQKRQCKGLDTFDIGRYYGYHGSYLGYQQVPPFTRRVVT
ncbi:uncharacterized protein LOC124146626 [Haliotis rufescens]|uniref:uncharacterized protein LOC124146626 n=1 Tax=Haliotis rufescens TaxID=6454 RepID=UPI00201E9D97|nr:uncharacterized protein LOC124146626 [Haliotis rufescens]